MASAVNLKTAGTALPADEASSPPQFASSENHTEYEAAREARFAKQTRRMPPPPTFTSQRSLAPPSGSSSASPQPFNVAVESSDSPDILESLLPPGAEGGGASGAAALTRVCSTAPGHLTSASLLARIREQKSAREAASRAQGQFRNFQRILVALLMAALLTAAAVTYLSDSVRDAPRLWLGVPTVVWLLMAALAIPAVLVLRVIVSLTVRFLGALASGAGLNYVHYMLIGLVDTLKFLSLAVVLNLCILYVTRWSSYDMPVWPPRNLLTKTGICVVIFAAVSLLNALICRFLSLRVNSSNLFDRLQEVIEQEVMLNRVMSKRHTLDHALTEERSAAIAAHRNIPEDSVEQYLDYLYSLAVTSDDRLRSFTERLMDLSDRAQLLTEDQSKEIANYAAEYCWLTLRQDPESSRLSRDDLLRVLEDEGATSIAFSSFDLDRNGYVQEHELHVRLEKSYLQRRNVALTLVDNEDVIATLKKIIGTIMHLMAFFVYCAIFGYQVLPILISLSSMAVGLIFIFGNSLRRTYESLVFLFMIRPYQVGDCILLHNERHWVKNFGIMSTRFTRFDGCHVWVPNETLMKSEIRNLSASGKLRVRATFSVDARGFVPAMCDDLAARLAAMMELPENRDLFRIDYRPVCYIQNIRDPLKYKIGLCYHLDVTGEDYIDEWEANGRVNHVVGLWLQANKIEHSTSVQPVKAAS